jgi:hypothetical protein
MSVLDDLRNDAALVSVTRTRPSPIARDGVSRQWICYSSEPRAALEERYSTESTDTASEKPEPSHAQSHYRKSRQLRMRPDASSLIPSSHWRRMVANGWKGSRLR